MPWKSLLNMLDTTQLWLTGNSSDLSNGNVCQTEKKLNNTSYNQTSTTFSKWQRRTVHQVGGNLRTSWTITETQKWLERYWKEKSPTNLTDSQQLSALGSANFDEGSKMKPITPSLMATFLNLSFRRQCDWWRNTRHCHHQGYTTPSENALPWTTTCQKFVQQWWECHLCMASWWQDEQNA